VDVEVLTDALWALSYITDGLNERIGVLLRQAPDIAMRLVPLLSHASPNVQTPALRTVGNCVSGDDWQTQPFVTAGVLPRLFALLSSPKKGLRKEAAWAVSNITAGNQEQIGAVLGIPGLVPRLLTLLKEGDFDIQKEACWAISNLTSGGSEAQIARVFELGAVPPLAALLVVSDPRVIEVAMTGLENILVAMGEISKRAGEVNPATTAIEECGGLDRLEQLQSHANESIYSKALSLLERFFAVEEEHEEVPVAHSAGTGTGTNNNQFSFGF